MRFTYTIIIIHVERITEKAEFRLGARQSGHRKDVKAVLDVLKTVFCNVDLRGPDDPLLFPKPDGVFRRLGVLPSFDFDENKTQRARRPLRGKDAIGMAVGKVLGHYKMGKRFDIVIEDASFRYQRKQAQIDAEAALDGVYVIRTSVKTEVASSEQAVFHYKSLSTIERAFRSAKSVDLKVRPIHHHLSNRVRAHVFLCMLAYYVEWHMRRALAPILFDDQDRATAQAQRQSVVAPATRSPNSLHKAHSKRTDDGMPVHSFQTLIADLATITKNTVLMNRNSSGGR